MVANNTAEQLDERKGRLEKDYERLLQGRLTKAEARHKKIRRKVKDAKRELGLLPQVSPTSNDNQSPLSSGDASASPSSISEDRSPPGNQEEESKKGGLTLQFAVGAAGPRPGKSAPTAGSFIVGRPQWLGGGLAVAWRWWLHLQLPVVLMNSSVVCSKISTGTASRPLTARRSLFKTRREQMQKTSKQRAAHKKLSRATSAPVGGAAYTKRNPAIGRRQHHSPLIRISIGGNNAGRSNAW